MKVLFLPDWQSNPYLSELASHLGSFGITTELRSRLDWRLVFSKFLGNGAVDILHLHWAHPFVLGKSIPKSIWKGLRFSLKLSVLKVSGVKLVWTIHNLFKHDSEYIKLELFFNRVIARLANGLIAHSHYAKQEIIKTYKISEQKISVIPHANYIDSYPVSISKQKARDRLKLHEGDIIFLYFGVVRSYKGIMDLVEAFGSLQASNAKLLIAGRPQDKGLSKEIEKRSDGVSGIILFLDYIPHNQVQIYMKAADIVVLPFHNIFTSGSLMLAMSFAKPIIASDTGSIPELLDSNGGFLFSVRSQGSLINALQQAYESSPEKLEKMGQRNFYTVKPFQWNTIAKHTSQVYKKVQWQISS